MKCAFLGAIPISSRPLRYKSRRQQALYVPRILGEVSPSHTVRHMQNHCDDFSLGILCPIPIHLPAYIKGSLLSKSHGQNTLF